jgi:hypothetical protein
MPRRVKSDHRLCKWKSCRDARVPKPAAIIEARKTDSIFQASFRGLVDSAELLAATKSTGHLVFDPRCLCGDKPLAYFYRTEGMILFQALDIDYRLVKALRKFCINSTNIYPEHPASSRTFKAGWETSIGEASIGVRGRRCAEAS